MHVPQRYRAEDDEALVGFLAEHGFATLVTAGAGASPRCAASSASS